MKKNLEAALMLIATAVVLAGAGGERGGRSHSTVYRQRRVSVSRPAMPSRGVSGQGRVAYPQHYGSGARIAKPAATRPPSHHAAVAANAGMVRGIRAQERSEVVPNHYYWHSYGGVRYSHYYDGHTHWYGFYHGPTFYWTRYYGDHWWWYDASFGRWVFWWDGFWWWPGPAGVPYIYAGNNYYPYETNGVTVEEEESQEPPASIPPASSGRMMNSPDGRRAVQITGSDAEAFLYDKTASPPRLIRYLGSNVAQARYSGGSAGAPLQVLVEFKDGTFVLYNTDGESQSTAVKSADSKSAPPPEAPASIPPPPTAAPGQ